MLSYTCHAIYVFHGGCEEESLCIHCLVHFLGRELAMYLLHRVAGLLHRQECFLVNVGRFDGIYLLL